MKVYTIQDIKNIESVEELIKLIEILYHKLHIIKKFGANDNFLFHIALRELWKFAKTKKE